MISIMASIIAFMSSSWSCVLLWSEARQIPFIIEETFSEIVLIKIESYLLGITLAVLTFPPEELIEAEIAPMRGAPSEIIKKQPF